MSSIKPDITRQSMGMRRHGARVGLPLRDRSRVRLGRAVENMLLNPIHFQPTFRRTIYRVVSQLRAQGMEDDEIRAGLASLIEEVAHSRGLNTKSVVTGKTRWVEVCERVVEWMAITGASS